MTSRERLTATLRGERVDRVPWVVDLDYYNSAMRDQGRSDARYEGVEGFLTQHEELGADPYFCYDCMPPCEVLREGVTVETRADGEERTTTYTMDGKSLVGGERYVRESFCWAPSKHPAETTEDVEFLIEMLSRSRVVPRLDLHDALQKQWGGRGLLLVGMPRTPVPALMAEWCGVMGTTYLRADTPGLFTRAVEALDRLYDPLYDAVAECGPVVVHFCDNISGETVMSFWDEWLAPAYRRRLGLLHGVGTKCVIHNDGTIRAVLGRIAAVGFDGAESLTPAPVGDVAAEELRELAGRDDFILWGMIPGAAFSRNWSEDEFREYVARVLDVCTGPMILGSADQVPPDGDPKRVRIVADMIAETYERESREG